MEISFTRYRIFRECPWKYKLIFIEGRRIPLNAKSSFGVSLHRTLEAWHRGGEKTLDSLLEALRGQWLAQGYADEETESRAYAKAERVLARFYHEEESRRARTIAVEKEFVWTCGPHEVRGMIDRIDQGPDGAYELIDYKTGPVAPTPDFVAADIQLRFYALGARRGLGLTPARLVMENVVVGARAAIEYKTLGEEALTIDISAVATAIEKGEFKADPGFCARCDFRSDCEFSTSR